MHFWKKQMPTFVSKFLVNNQYNLYRLSTNAAHLINLQITSLTGIGNFPVARKGTGTNTSQFFHKFYLPCEFLTNPYTSWHTVLAFLCNPNKVFMVTGTMTGSYSDLLLFGKMDIRRPINFRFPNLDDILTSSPTSIACGVEQVSHLHERGNKTLSY